ncbi:ketopantoate hydroxymethyltransferase [Heyndrickxia sporothermodurans]
MIEPRFMNNVAQYVKTQVAKVVLNGTLPITDFIVKQVTDNILALNYIVRAKDISVITKIELIDSNNAVVSTNSVNIPITTDQRMIQEIEVKEE